MDGEKKFVLVVICLTMICLTVLYVFLFISLWPYRIWVGVSLLMVVIGTLASFVLTGVLGSLNEQQLRRERVRYHEELPTDRIGQPYYMPNEMQVFPRQSDYPYSAYNTYPYQEQERGYYGNN